MHNFLVIVIFGLIILEIFFMHELMTYMHSTINKLCLDAISFPGIHFYGFLRNLQDIKKKK